MSADQIRQAATVLRERSTAATGGPWHWEQYRDDLPFLVGRDGDPTTYAWDEEVIQADHHGECGCRSACRLELTVRREDQAYIATVDPSFGAAVAELLEALAGEMPNDTYPRPGSPLHGLVNQLLGEA